MQDVSVNGDGCPKWCGELAHRFAPVSPERAFRVHVRMIGLVRSSEDQFAPDAEVTEVSLLGPEELDVLSGRPCSHQPLVQVDQRCFTLAEARVLIGLLNSAVSLAESP